MSELEEIKTFDNNTKDDPEFAADFICFIFKFN